MILARWFKRFDVGVTKRFDVGGARNVDVRFDVLNVMDNPNFTPVNAPTPMPATPTIQAAGSAS